MPSGAVTPSATITSLASVNMTGVLSIGFGSGCDVFWVDVNADTSQSIKEKLAALPGLPAGWQGGRERGRAS